MLKQALLLFLFSVSVFSFAQTGTNSPYSRFGVGDLQPASYIKNRGMGGTSIAYSGLYSTNIVNPASLTSIYLTTFEIGLKANLTSIETNQLKQKSNNAGLNYFSFAFPVKYKKWGTAFGLMPYSSVGYSFFYEDIGQDNVKQEHYFEGYGGIDQVFLSNAWSPFKGLSIGLNAAYLFGTTYDERRVEFSDRTYVNTRIIEGINYGDFYFSGGLLYTKDSLKLSPSDSINFLDVRLKSIEDSLYIIDEILDGLESRPDSASQVRKSEWEKQLAELSTEYEKTFERKRNVKVRKQRGDWTFSAGLVSSLSSEVKATQSKVTESYKYFGGNIQVIDTIATVKSNEGTVQLPFSYGVGLSMRKGNRLLFLADFSSQNWAQFVKFGEADSLEDSWKISSGIQFTPNDRSLTNYLDIIQYRIGFRYEQTYLQLRNTALKEYALSFGFGLPMRRVATTINLFGEFGRRGTTDNNLIEENFFRFGVGITINDRWFVKPKFD